MGKGKRKPLRGGQGSVKSARKGDGDESKDDLRGDAAREEENSDSSDSDGDITLEGKSGDVLQMTFDFKDMKEEYSYGIANMLPFLLTPTRVAQELAEMIAVQEEVGTAILCEEGDDVFGYATILPVPSIQSSNTQLKSVVDALVVSVDGLGPNSEGAVAMRRALSGAGAAQTGILLHGRFVNLPLELVPHLHRNLLDDLTWAQSDESREQGAANPFDGLSQCVLLAPVSVTEGYPSPKRGQCINITGSSSSAMFHHFEDDVFAQESTCTLLFKSPHGSPESVCAAILVPVAVMSSTCIPSIAQLVPS
ncbi:BCP1 [Symbiodinium microadriaticum]|nr:BCP1 [Symbiodinium microadriaticum]